MTQKLSDSLKSAIQDAFDKIDTAKTGSLSKEGVREVLQLIGQNPTKTEMNEYFQKSDTLSVNRDYIGDFIEKYVPLKSQSKINEEIAEAFAKFDTNEEFVISKADFREILTKLGDEPLTDIEVESVMDCLDKTSDKVNVSDLSTLLSG